MPVNKKNEPQNGTQRALLVISGIGMIDLAVPYHGNQFIYLSWLPPRTGSIIVEESTPTNEPISKVFVFERWERKNQEDWMYKLVRIE